MSFSREEEAYVGPSHRRWVILVAPAPRVGNASLSFVSCRVRRGGDGNTHVQLKGVICHVNSGTSL
jgi:hypothetical protein